MIVIVHDGDAARGAEIASHLARRLACAVAPVAGATEGELLAAAARGQHLVVVGSFRDATDLALTRRSLGSVDGEVHAYRVVDGPAGGAASAESGDAGLPVSAAGRSADAVAGAIWQDACEMVVLSPPDPFWAQKAEHERALLARELGALAISIEHVGSTAVAGLAAKPVVDILVTIDRLDDPARLLGPMGQAGYAFVDYPENISRWFFRKGTPRSHHVHVAEHGGSEHRALLDFRDALRADAVTRESYERLKHALAAAHPRERAAYGAGKTAFVDATLAAWRARATPALPGVARSPPGGGGRLRRHARRAFIFTRALGSNAVNMVSKDLHAALRRSTGRGVDGQPPETIARYFQFCLQDYCRDLGVPDGGVDEFLRGKVVLEYGPGDIPGVALLMVARGAERAICVDRFPLLRLSETNRAAVTALAASLPPAQRERLASCFTEPDHRGALHPDRVRVVVDRDGLSGLRGQADIVISRAVLEHVNRLDRTLEDSVLALRPGGVACHVVDLKSHGFEWEHPLDFLTVPSWLWRSMSSHNGSMSNRRRLSDYRRIVAGLPVSDLTITPTDVIPPELAESIRPRLAREFASCDLDDLTTLGFWMSLCRA